eukprot:scaffold90317_cov15-Tisochrysis_lutea.AAC.1
MHQSARIKEANMRAANAERKLEDMFSRNQIQHSGIIRIRDEDAHFLVSQRDDPATEELSQ